MTAIASCTRRLDGSQSLTGSNSLKGSTRTPMHHFADQSETGQKFYWSIWWRREVRWILCHHPSAGWRSWHAPPWCRSRKSSRLALLLLRIDCYLEGSWASLRQSCSMPHYQDWPRSQISLCLECCVSGRIGFLLHPERLGQLLTNPHRQPRFWSGSCNITSGSPGHNILERIWCGLGTAKHCWQSRCSRDWPCLETRSHRSPRCGGLCCILTFSPTNKHHKIYQNI